MNNSSQEFNSILENLLFDLQHRRIEAVTINDMQMLLMYYIKSELKVDKNYQSFIDTCEKFIAKHSELITAEQMLPICKMMMVCFDDTGILNPAKLYLKLQRKILTFVENEAIDLNSFASILRLFAEAQVTQSSSLFEEMNFRLAEGALGELD